MGIFRKNQSVPDIAQPGTEKYNPVAAILILTWPVVLEMGLHTFVWIFDTAMVMRLGAPEATAVAYGGLVLFYTLMIFGAMSRGTNSQVARYIGAKDMKLAALAGGQALSIALMIMLVIIVAGLFFGKFFFSWVIQDAETALLAVDYFYMTILSGGGALLPLLVINGIIRGTGNTRVPMVIALIANAYNVVGDYVLIFGHFGFPTMGVKGAALATGSAQLLGFLLSVAYLFMYKKGKLPLSWTCLFPVRKEMAMQVLRLSIPAGAEELTHSGSYLLSASWITSLGPISYAANAVVFSAVSFSFWSGQAFAITATTLVGQLLGGGYPKQARITGYWACVLGTILLSSISLIFLFFPYEVMSLFNPPEPEVLRLGILCLQVAAAGMPFIAITIIFSGALKGTGDTRGPFKVGLYTNLFIRLPLIYAIIYIFHYDITYIWWVTAFQYATSGLFMFLLYRKKKWDQF